MWKLYERFQWLKFVQNPANSHTESKQIEFSRLKAKKRNIEFPL